MAKVKRTPKRAELKAQDTWDLSKLFKSDAAWMKGYKKLEGMIAGFADFKGKLGDSAKALRACLDFDQEFDKLADRLGVYAYLKYTENVAENQYQAMVAQFSHVATQAGEAASFITPEIQAIPQKKMAAFLQSKELAAYRFQLEKLLRFRPHILSEKEERLLAMQGEVAGTASKVFGQLDNADLKFGFVKNEQGESIELSHASFRSLLESPKRTVRKNAFNKYYAAYEAHANTFAATLSGSVLQDVYRARARNFPSALEAALFGDKVPLSVYDQLTESVHAHLDTLYHYFEIRRQALGIREIRAYDTYAPIVQQARVNIPYEKAVETICEAVAPLGAAYVKTLCKGLIADRWVDRYENEGKQSGAFSYGCYQSPPYIMMNYRRDVLDSMFTLAHEGGHSMHSYYSRNAQPYQYHQYTIFVAEVASTVNEQLLSQYLLGRAANKRERANLVCREIDQIRGTIIRQTMFAEYERVIHAMAEAGEPLTLDSLRAAYRDLLELYFGPDFTLDEALDLEALRIPHFYNAFYVYKYATGLSAAIALSQQVLSEGRPAQQRYLRFLKSGGSDYPLAQLAAAGVDLTSPAPVVAAMGRLAQLVDELEGLL